MITLYGVTEDGTTVPVQVTEDGKLVVHKEGGYTPGMDLEAGTITSGNIQSSGNVTAASYLRSDTSLDPSTDQSRQGRWTLNPGASLNVANFVDRSSGEEVTTVGITRVGDITTQGTIRTAGSAYVGTYQGSTDGVSGCLSSKDGCVYAQRSSSYTGNGHLFRGLKGNTIVFRVQASGAFAIGDSLAGMTKDGEIYFTSRGQRYKIVVQNGMCMADTYTREQQIRDGLIPDIDTTDIVLPD